jgi:hypothetical protein
VAPDLATARLVGPGGGDEALALLPRKILSNPSLSLFDHREVEESQPITPTFTTLGCVLIVLERSDTELSFPW